MVFLGNKDLQGAQLKDMVIENGDKVFIKVDTFKDGRTPYFFNETYPSIHDTLTSIVIKNIKNLPFDNVLYTLDTMSIDGEIVTCAKSKNFLQDDEVELVLSREANTAYLPSQQLMSNINYIKHFFEKDSFTRDSILKELVGDELVKQLKHQALLDILTVNRDRLSNPANIVFAENAIGKRLVNLDYGRCFYTGESWALTNEALYNDNRLETLSDQLVKSFSTADSLFELDYITKEGFDPFEIDIVSMKQDFQDFVKKVQNMNLPCKNYVKVLTAAIEKHIESSILVKDISLVEPVESLTTTKTMQV